MEATNNKGVVSYKVPGDEPGQTGDQQTGRVSILINLEEVATKLALDDVASHPLWPLAGSSKAGKAAISVVECAVEQGSVVLGIAEHVLAKCNPDLGAADVDVNLRRCRCNEVRV